MNSHRMYGNKWAEIAKVLPGRYTYLLNIVEKGLMKNKVNGHF